MKLGIKKNLNCLKKKNILFIKNIFFNIYIKLVMSYRDEIKNGHYLISS